MNYTIRQIAGFSGDHIGAVQPQLPQMLPVCCVIDLPDFTICSASPELFFERNAAKKSFPAR
ncbi:MAG: hypothetical protein R3C26_20990 [Calditrichia bacterium]